MDVSQSPLLAYNFWTRFKETTIFYETSYQDKLDKYIEYLEGSKYEVLHKLFNRLPGQGKSIPNELLFVDVEDFDSTDLAIKTILNRPDVMALMAYVFGRRVCEQYWHRRVCHRLLV